MGLLDLGKKTVLWLLPDGPTQPHKTQPNRGTQSGGGRRLGLTAVASQIPREIIRPDRIQNVSRELIKSFTIGREEKDRLARKAKEKYPEPAGTFRGIRFYNRATEYSKNRHLSHVEYIETDPPTVRRTHENSRHIFLDTRRKKVIHDTYIRIKMGKATAKDYNEVANAILKILPQEEYDDGSIGPILVRLAWHASGTYDAETDTGGSNGATMRFEVEAKDEANNGLEEARKFLEPIKQQFPWITYADLWTLAGAVSVEALGGPKIDWKPGRVDYVDEQDVPPNGRLPDGSLAEDHVRHIFYRMGFNDQEIVALCGAHNLGRTHYYRSGFDGPWVPNPTQFANTYFKLLMNEEWHWGKSPAGVDQFYDEDDDLMMLPTDMALINDEKFFYWVKQYAENKDIFFDHFAKAYAKLLELGVHRDENGIAKVNKVKPQAKL